MIFSLKKSEIKGFVMEENKEGTKELERGLSNRHIQLIALGGAIGTGLFMGAGKTIHLAGPSILLVYSIIGIMLFFVMRALGEVLLSNLKYRSFNDIAGDLLGENAAFFTGWTYWFCWITMGTANVIAVVSYTQFWWPSVPIWLPSGLCIVLLYFLNLVSVKVFGELEFWFSMVKIIAIVFLIIVGGYLVFTGFVSPSGNKAELSNIWKHGGIFPNGIMGFFAGFQIAVFAFVGVELVGMTAAETRDPKKTLPKAINAIPIRIIIFYVFALIAIISVTPWNLIDPDKSPFVEMFVLAGIASAAGIINFVVLTSAASAANSGVYSISRMIYGLGLEKQAPKIMTKLSKNHIPNNALLFSVICLGIATFVLLASPTIMEAFTIVTTISAVCFMFIWTIILLFYIAYRKKRPELHEKSCYKMPGGVVMCYVVLAFFAFVIVLLMFEPDTLKALLLTPIWFVILFIANVIRKGKRDQEVIKNPESRTENEESL